MLQRSTSFAALFTLAVALVPCLLALDPASAQHISPESLDNVKAELRQAVASGSIASGAHMVVINGEVPYFEVAGVSDIEDKTPLQANTIMRVYSMTKPITSVAAMTLYEQGKFQLDDPVAKYIPTFEKTSVLVKAGDSHKLVDAERQLTIRDVFRHTTGYSYGRDNAEIRKYYEQEGVLYRDPHAMMPPEMTIAQAADALSRIPALHQPGARFTYGFNTDLLGRLIEVWSGKTLDEYMREAVLAPLAMVDTGFSIPKDKRDRFASCHAWESGQQVIADKAGESPFNDGFEFLSGGGGLVSTMQDYANFCQMMIDRGEFQDKRVLKEETIQLMFTDQLNGVGGKFKFGLGFAIGDVTLGSGDTARKVPSYYWGGYANTAFRLVPDANLYQVFMRQSVPSTHRIANKLFPIVYEGVKK